jgi:hypothetical protein
VKLTLAEQLLLLSYGDESGKPLISTSHLDCGLAGAHLLDLSYAGQLGIEGGKLQVNGDPAGDPVLASIAAKPPHSADWWVYHLATPSRREQLLRGLVSAGVLEEHTHRFRHSTYPESDPSAERELAAHLRAVTDGTVAPDDRSIALIGLAHACGLDKHLFPGRDRQALRHRLTELTQGEWCGHAVGKVVDAMNIAVLHAVSGGALSSTASPIPAT